MEETMENFPDRLSECFHNRTIFVTGGTGFVGKVLIERLLRIFDVKVIYILIRIKKDKDTETRFNEIFLSPLFDSVRSIKGDRIFEKCKLISGDVTMPNMNISPEDIATLQRNVEFVIHSAATVRFDDPLKKAVLINTRGTQQMLDLAKGMEKLQIFVHISTAYCHPEEKVLYEKSYPSTAPPGKILDLVDWMREEQLEEITPTLLDNIPNTYTFSKALAEEVTVAEMDNLPIIIVRPSIVLPMWKEPLPGWTDNLNGPMGLLIGAGKGVIRSMHGNRDATADFVSVDGVADGIFCAITNSLLEGMSRRIINFCTSQEVIISWGEIIELGKEVAAEHVPFDTILWAPGGNIRKSKILHMFSLIFYHFLPALIVDTLAYCCGYKPFLWNVQKRIRSGMVILEYYTNNEWTFNYDNLLYLRNWLNPREKARYTVDCTTVNIKEYFITCALAARRYVLKEPEENLPRAKRMMKRMIWLDRVCNLLIKLLLVYLFYKLLVSCPYLFPKQ